MAQTPHHNHLPAWSWIAPVLAGLFLTLLLIGVVPTGSLIINVAAAALLGGTVFAAVHHAEVLALKLGEPFGSILLAIAVTVIEVGLIISIMFSGTPDSDVVARDTIFATVMIVLNGVIGLCLVLGGQRHFEQTFHLQGAASALGVLGTLATIALILPNYTVAADGPHYSSLQLLMVGLLSLVLWGVFVFVQTVRHRDYFLDELDDAAATEAETAVPANLEALISLGLLLLALTAVVLLAKILSPPLSAAVAAAGLPKAFVGVVIAGVVLLPEGMAAVKSSLRNRLQNSINLSLGSAIASIGLTVPAVAMVSLLLDRNISVGISPANITLLVLTMFVSTLTLGTGRTTVLQGAIHLVIFGIFLLITAVP